MLKIISHSEKQTFNLGKKLAKQFKGGKVVGLIGELGAGKTVLIKGVAAGLGIKKTITSPTFVLMKVYKIKDLRFKIKSFIHVDAYRLESGRDLIDIGLKDWLCQSNTITVIEWADRVKSILPKNTITIKIKMGKKKNERIINILQR
ncbi:MAG: tRNA (adenosine(37)-N6)-threonylcarbamoyltransferase complex ATPase subunit type 1 TsaE [Patescibacteria group bacterium]